VVNREPYLIEGPEGVHLPRELGLDFAREVMRTVRRRRAAGRLQHGRQYAIPKKRRSKVTSPSIHHIRARAVRRASERAEA
jgi:hypothetical protein